MPNEEARVDVIGRTGPIGRVLVVPPFGPPLARAIGVEAHLPGGRLGFLLDHRLVRGAGVGRLDSRPTVGKATDVRMQALEYRAVAQPLGEGRLAPALITVRKRSRLRPTKSAGA